MATLLAWSPAAFASASTHADAREPKIDRAAAFDATFQALVGPQSLDRDTARLDADLERLRALLPAGDRLRDARFRSMYCASSTWKDTQLGLAYADAALARARDARDLASQARAQLCRAYFIGLTGGDERSLPELDKAVALLSGGKEPLLLAQALELRGEALSMLGEQAKAMLEYRRANDAYHKAGLGNQVESLTLRIAVAYRRMGDWPQAQRHFVAAKKRLQDAGRWEIVTATLIQLGFLHGDSGSPDKALASFREAESVAMAHHITYLLNAARLGIAESQIMLGHADVALATLQQARDGFVADHDASNDDMLLLLQGRALAKLGKHADALERYRQALPLIERDGNERYLAILLKAQSASNEALGRNGPALADYKRYAALQLELQGKMRLQQDRMLEYDYEIRRRNLENRQLRAQAAAKQQEVATLERIRRWQWLAIALGGLLMAALTALAWRQRRKSRRLRRLILQDSLTGVANRPGIEHLATQALAESMRDNTPLSLLALDLDHFKSINDRYGHAAGDKVLRATTTAWQALLRGRDALGRVGGEEFVVVCVDTALEQAQAVANRLHEATRALRFDEIDPALRVSVSIGMAQAHKADDSFDALLERADSALYRAKQQGRDRTES